VSFLLDTQHLLWLFIEPEKITKPRVNLLLDEKNNIYFSQVSLWEISIKYKLRKLKLGGGTPEDFYHVVENSFLHCLLLENTVLISSYQLPLLHKDPFDRLLIWQSICNDLSFISSDRSIGDYIKYNLKLA